MSIKYVSKDEMISKHGDNYFGLTKYLWGGESEITVRYDLPDSVQRSVMAHEEYHARNGIDSSEFGAAIEGFKADKIGFCLSIILSLRPSRLKMYPKTTSIVAVCNVLGVIIYLDKFL